MARTSRVDEQGDTAPEIQKRLIHHHERRGNFADAEDVLFDLIDAGTMSSS